MIDIPFRQMPGGVHGSWGGKKSKGAGFEI